MAYVSLVACLPTPHLTAVRNRAWGVFAPGREDSHPRARLPRGRYTSWVHRLPSWLDSPHSGTVGPRQRDGTSRTGAGVERVGASHSMAKLPVSASEFEARRERVKEMLAANGLGAMLAFGSSFYDRPGPVAYLSGHYPPFPNSPFGAGARGLGYACLIIPTTSPPVLLVDARGYRSDLVDLRDVRAGNDLVASLVSLLRERGLLESELGIAGSDILPYAFIRDVRQAAPDLELRNLEPSLHLVRAIKSPAEQAALRAAAEIAGIGLRAAVDAIHPAATEQAVCAAGTAAALAAGADFVRYLRVHSGPWSGGGSRWPQATDRVLRDGDIVVLDIIGSFAGYAFDVNRTTTVGTLSPDDRRFLELGLAATEAAVAAARPGAAIAAVVDAARQVVLAAGFPTLLPASAGHGIGIETVETPYLMAGDPTVLEPGMVLCIEPSIFEPGKRGCAIEQEVIVTHGAPEVITTFPSRLW